MTKLKFKYVGYQNSLAYAYFYIGLTADRKVEKRLMEELKKMPSCKETQKAIEALDGLELSLKIANIAGDVCDVCGRDFYYDDVC